MDRARASRILRQEAETARFLGVDFLPTRPAAPDAPVEPARRAPAEAAPEPDVRFAVRRDRPSGAAASPPPGPPPGPPPSPGPARLGPAGDYRPVEVPEGELSRDEAQALLDEVRARYERDAPHQHFVTDHHSIVFGEGDPRADLMFIGEAPGETEDQLGRPFVGKAGQLLDKMIVAMGLARESVYICNVLKTRPPNNQTPTSEEAELCAPYLLDQIRVVRPRAIVTLGLPATRLLLGTSDAMRALRGRFHDFPPPDALGPWRAAPVRPARVMPTYHPAYLLRSYTPENRRKVWSDLKQVMDYLAGAPAGGA